MKFLNCLITGASSGIGKAISEELSKSARHIYITSRNIKKLEEVHDNIIKNKCKCTIVPLDLHEDDGIENLAKQIYEKDKFIDVLILSAGIINQLSPVDSIELSNIKKIVDLNFLSNFRMIKNFHPLLKNSNGSNLVLISSFKDNSKTHYWGIYQPIMSALNELFLYYANENQNSKIKANIFSPNAVKTGFRESIMPGEDKNKILTPEEVAVKIVEFIKTTKTTGEIIKFD